MKTAVLALAVALATSATAIADERSILQLRRWIDAVDSHAAGQHDAALAVVTGWSYDDIEQMRPYIEAVVLATSGRGSDRDKRRTTMGSRDVPAILNLTRSLQRRGDFEHFRKRAAILHTDAAIFGGPPPVVTAPTLIERNQRRVIVRSFDGQVKNFELPNLHWELAMDVLDSLPARPARDPIVGQWYRAIGAYFARERQFADAMVLFDRGRRLAPNHAGLLYGEACLEETLAAPRVQNYVRITTLPNGLTIRGVWPPQTHFGRAASLLQRALAADSALAEAHLRLGRVLTRLQRNDDALPYLRHAIANAPDASTAYYAHLFLGDALEALGSFDEARRAYQSAVALFPRSQAARLALGFVLRSQGDRRAARTVIDPALEPSARDPDDDPWWNYYDGDATQVDRLLAELRAPFTRPR